MGIWNTHNIFRRLVSRVIRYDYVQLHRCAIHLTSSQINDDGIMYLVASELRPRDQHTISHAELLIIAYEAKRKVKSGLHRCPILLFSHHLLPAIVCYK